MVFSAFFFFIFVLLLDPNATNLYRPWIYDDFPVLQDTRVRDGYG